MAATQANLHQFYKARKTAREPGYGKNAKANISKLQEIKSEDILAVSEGHNAVKTERTEDVRDGGIESVRTPKPKLSLINHSLAKKESLSSKKNNGRKTPRPSGTQDIASVFERVAAKRKREEEEEEAENLISLRSDASRLDSIHVTPPVTPKRKKEEDEEEKKKRRKQANEDGLDRTPNGPDNVTPGTAPKSAKKKLLMASENVLKDKMQEKTPENSPRKMMSPRKLTPAEIKERLGKCGRLDQLRSKLLKVNQCEEKLKQFNESRISEKLRLTDVASPSKTAVHPQLEKFAALDVEVPVSPRKTPVKAPAHERFQHLVEKPSEELALPYKYRFVKEVFRAVDTVVSLLHNRQEVITFSKLKPAVQELLRKAFSERHLGEIKSVFPLAYIFKQEMSKNTGRSVREGRSSGYELTVTANLDYKSASRNLMSKFDDKPQMPKFRKMDSVVMVERKNIFHNSLISILREQHTEFLKSLDPPIKDCGANIKRWHPAFPLEDIPEIVPSPLPQPPVTEKLDTAQDILTKAQDMFSVNPRLEKAVTEAAARTPTKAPAEPPSDQPAQPANVIAALKGVSSSLLEKIRAREAANAMRDMTRSTTENKELEMLSRLSEISRIIRNIFVTEKKAALPWETVAAKVAASYPSMLAGNEVDSHLNLLIKEVPGWCTVHKVRSGVFLKINKNEPQSNINDKIQAVMKQKR